MSYSSRVKRYQNIPVLQDVLLWCPREDVHNEVILLRMEGRRKMYIQVFLPRALNLFETRRSLSKMRELSPPP